MTERRPTIKQTRTELSEEELPWDSWRCMNSLIPAVYMMVLCTRNQPVFPHQLHSHKKSEWVSMKCKITYWKISVQGKEAKDSWKSIANPPTPPATEGIPTALDSYHLSPMAAQAYSYRSIPRIIHACMDPHLRHLENRTIVSPEILHCQPRRNQRDIQDPRW